MKLSLGLRSKIIFLASFFLILPWLGYQYILEMENFLRQGQEQTLQGTTRAIATALHERPKLFNVQVNALNKIEDGKDLFAYDLQNEDQQKDTQINQLIINGELDDWQASITKSLIYQKPSYQRNKNSNNPISFRHMLATQGQYLYGYLKVTDKYPTFRDKNSRFLNHNDHLILAMNTTNNQLRRYIVSLEKPGWFNAYQLSERKNDNLPPSESGIDLASDVYQYANQQREKRIQGFWKLTKQGYNIEFRLPIAMLSDKFGFALHTTDNRNSGEIDNIIATSNTNNLQQLGSIVVPSPEIDNILKGLSHTQSRLWVIDRHKRVLASAGDIHHAAGVWGNNNETTLTAPSWWQKMTSKLLSPLYERLFSLPNNEFVDELQGSTKLDSEFINKALSGESHSSWRLTNDNKAMILSAASPILIGDKVMGMVIAEETTNGIRSLRNQALQKLFNTLIAIIVIATVLLFWFTANIATRITKLRDQAESSIDDQGKISAPFTPISSTDEIGDLSRSLASMVNRLGEYHRYLEKLPSRLSHELGTPVAVVRSSLENLSLLPQDEQGEKYITRAQTGINRLNRILTNMSEATRLEQSLQSGEKISLPLRDFLTSCVQGYQMTYPKQIFQFESSQHEVTINADPDFMVQCLDKLINNAMEFSLPESPINIQLSQTGNDALIQVSNKGPLLPDNMGDELLNSMVSVRSKKSNDKTHLGLGLFIAKMICDFHQGSISLSNNKMVNNKNDNVKIANENEQVNNDGVTVTLRLPIN